MTETDPEEIRYRQQVKELAVRWALEGWTHSSDFNERRASYEEWRQGAPDRPVSRGEREGRSVYTAAYELVLDKREG